MVIIRGGAVSYERGTPAPGNLADSDRARGPGVPLPSEEGTTLRKVVMAFTGEPRLESGLDCLIQGLLEIKDTHRPRVLP